MARWGSCHEVVMGFNRKDGTKHFTHNMQDYWTTGSWRGCFVNKMTDIFLKG